MTYFSRLLTQVVVLCCLSVIPLSKGFSQDDDPAGIADMASVEELYNRAGELSLSGQYALASLAFEKIFDLSGGKETLFEDWGAQAGGFYFDYGMTLLPQERWDEAKEAFTTSLDAAKIAEEVQTPIKNQNQRENLSRFQLGFVEAQVGNHAEAIRLYDLYLENNPPNAELAQIRNSFKLNYGASQMALGQTAEGTATIQEIFDNREAWQATPQFLMQAVLSMGQGWIEEVNVAGNNQDLIASIERRANAFLDKNVSAVRLSPVQSFGFGFVDRFRMLSVESVKSGLYGLALRYLSFTPTLEQVKQDIDLSLARLPVGADVPSQYQRLLD
ncbi:MAG: hypothetical protein AAF357_12845, partial [Verrucomicrobiota bacterium]